jgi:methyl-accepting chemotaxis protein
MNSPEPDLEALLQALQALHGGDLAVRLPRRGDGTAGEVYDAFNKLAEQRQELVRREEERYRGLADAMPQIVWTAGPTASPTTSTRAGSSTAASPSRRRRTTAGSGCSIRTT